MVTTVSNPCAAARELARDLIIDVNLAGDEKEDVANAVDDDAAVNHCHAIARITEREEKISQGPGGHRKREHPFDAEARK